MSFKEEKNQVLLDKLKRIQIKHDAMKAKMESLLDEYDKLSDELSLMEKEYLEINDVLKERLQ